jgi:hypothetical protein
VPGDGSVLTTGVLSVGTEGGDIGTHQGFATSSGSVADVNLLAGLLTADAISSTCTSNGDGSNGSVTLVNAVLAGNPLASNPAPNTVIPVAGGGTFTLNEQIEVNDIGTQTSVTVNAVHLVMDPLLGSGTSSSPDPRARPWAPTSSRIPRWPQTTPPPPPRTPR